MQYTKIPKSMQQIKDIRLFEWMYCISEIIIYCCILLDTNKLRSYNTICVIARIIYIKGLLKNQFNYLFLKSIKVKVKL